MSATLTMKLVADNGYKCDTSYRVSPEQWAGVLKVCEGADNTELETLRAQNAELLAALEELVEFVTPSFCECEPDVGYQCRACNPYSVVKSACEAIANAKKGEQLEN